MPGRFRISIALFGCVCPAGGAVAAEIDFNRDVRPILSENCFFCHGPDANKRKADLRLDSREGAITGGAINPDTPTKSALIARISDADPEEVMPPPESKLKLNPAQIATLRAWAEAGGEYAVHWAFAAPIRAQPPEIAVRVRNPIDHFVFAGLAARNIAPSPDADPAILLRRVTLDLTGLPPTLDALDSFLSDPSDKAFAAYVDELLSSSAYGERMALPWLDAARYADTSGYQGDFRITQWPWRDWVIDAFNANMPFDQFTIEQLAGDLLANPTDQQLLATAFNRNHRINNEGGVIPAEFLVEYVADRLETTSTVWLGLTAGCARCHDHKYDPISQQDYYEMFAFFHNVPENGKDGPGTPKPFMGAYTGGTKEEHAELRASIAVLKQRQEDLPRERGAAFQAWLDEREVSEAVRALPVASLHFPLDFPADKTVQDARHVSRKAVIMAGATKVDNLEFGGGFTFDDSGYLKAGGAHGREGFSAARPRTWSVALRAPKSFTEAEGPVLAAWDDDTDRGYRIVLEGSGEPGKPYRISFRVYHDREARNGFEALSDPIVPRAEFARIAVSYDGSSKASGARLFFNGAEVRATAQLNQLSGDAATKAPLLLGARSEKEARAGDYDATFRGGEIDDVQIYDTALSAEQIATIHGATPETLLLVGESKSARDYLQRLFLNRYDPAGQQLLAELRKAEAELTRFEKEAITQVSVMEEMAEPRKTYKLTRGAYDHPDTGEVLRPNVFDVLPPMGDGLPRNRLGLAKWIVAEDNPLTARVAVNRFWQQFFGVGLVKTSEDFGSQGEPPSHPELLDWLAVEFRESGWDIQKLLKLIVTSSTYRQSSAVTPALLEMDPENRLLARGPRFRLSGQALRDQALAVSGLLEPKVGGPPVMPYQPAGLWEELSAKSYKWIEATGPDLYRRSLYTFWRRTSPPPNMMNFDGVAREACSVRTGVTNTPLQAMNLMNDPQFVEAARALAQRMLNEGGEDPLGHGFRLATGRTPSQKIAAVLQIAHRSYLDEFCARPEGAKALLTVGRLPVPEAADPVELAAMTALANVILNLDAFVTKE